MGSRSQANKAHKTKYRSKSSRNAHKVSSSSAKGKVQFKTSKRPKQVVSSKAARLQTKEPKIESIPSPPRVIMLFGLSSSVDIDSLQQDILSSLHADGVKWGMRATVLKAPHGDLLACMEMAKVADLIAFVASPKSLREKNDPGHFIDTFGSQCLFAFEKIGLPRTIVLIRDLPANKIRQQELKNMCKSKLASKFPEDCKFCLADDKNDIDNKFMWVFNEQKPISPHWRNMQSYVLGQKVRVVADRISSSKCTLLLTGYVRAQGLSVNQLVHLTGAGDFQLSKIELLKDPYTLKASKRADLMDYEEIENEEVLSTLTPDPLKQERLVVENVPDPLAGEQTWPIEAEMAEVDKEKKMKKKRHVSRITDDSEIDYSGSNEKDEDHMMMDVGDEQGSDSYDDIESISATMGSENLTEEQIEEQIRKIKEAHADDEEFPDEVDTPLHIVARKRFAKYRSVKSLRTSLWDPKESLPPEYGRIMASDNFRRTKNHVLAEAPDMKHDLEETAPMGSYVRLYIKDVPESVASKLSMRKTRPLIAVGLLPNESKLSVLHFRIRKHDAYTAPIKAKEELLFHVGFRQIVSRPIFSSDDDRSNMHKMERFLHPGQFCIASIYAPISSPSLPLIAFKSLGEDTPPVIAAVGTLINVDPDRIIVKKIVLTGYPQRVSKLKSTVRFMFHNPEDVRFFKTVEVETKGGRRGRIKEPLGTHGAMKCIFNGALQQNDTVCMSLYKRTYPKWPPQWYPLQDA